MANLNKKIDAHLKSDRRKTVFISVIISAIILPLIIYLFLPNMGERTQVSGVVVSIYGKPVGEMGTDLYLLVKLDNGDEIKSLIENSAYYRKGKRVNLNKVESLTFGNPTYSFRAYINE